MLKKLKAYRIGQRANENQKLKIKMKNDKARMTAELSLQTRTK
jgi:hypothetical protein